MIPPIGPYGMLAVVQSAPIRRSVAFVSIVVSISQVWLAAAGISCPVRKTGTGCPNGLRQVPAPGFTSGACDVSGVLSGSVNVSNTRTRLASATIDADALGPHAIVAVTVT